MESTSNMLIIAQYGAGVVMSTQGGNFTFLFVVVYTWCRPQTVLYYWVLDLLHQHLL